MRPNARPIDRRAVVARHNVVVTRLDPMLPLSVGNGEFAFTADVTGLQTFPAAYAEAIPLCTQSQWGWHSFPTPAGSKPEAFRFAQFESHGRQVGYAVDATGQEALFDHLRESPHRLHLGRIGLVLAHADGREATPAEVTEIRQELDLWTGLLTSRFVFDGQTVTVETCCPGELDAVAVRVTSPLVRGGRLRVRLAFPYGSPQPHAADWTRPEAHETRLQRCGGRRAELSRRLDGDAYAVGVEWSAPAELSQESPHEFHLRGGGSETLQCVVAFAPATVANELPSFDEATRASAAFWSDYWSSGGAIDFAGSADARAAELERRVVLSQYLMRVNCAGSLPPAETGLTCNSWYGKFHLEMHWWHGVHWALWDRLPLLERSLDYYYRRILPVARRIAERQGYAGARWPKMVGPDGHDSPSPVGPLLLWQQPHPIYYAELCYRKHPSRQTLERWRPVVEETAAFMASFAAWDEASRRFVLGPPMKAVSENTDPRATRNAAFELTYWRFGLRVAQEWRERLGQPRQAEWDRVLEALAPLPQADGLYLFQEGMTDTYTHWNWEHPALAGICGVLPGDGVDAATHRRTVERVMQVWQWDRCWGWDFPMMAMSAARAGRPDLAVDALFLTSKKNTYSASGHNYQRPNLPLYLPGNGGLLAAVAMMAAGWDGGSEGPAPGFPADGWVVRHEGLQRMP